MGNNLFVPTGPREATQVCTVSTFSVVEVGNVHRKTVRHDGYTGVWVCVETAACFPRFGLSFVRHGCQKWYVFFLLLCFLSSIVDMWFG